MYNEILAIAKELEEKNLHGYGKQILTVLGTGLEGKDWENYKKVKEEIERLEKEIEKYRDIMDNMQDYEKVATNEKYKDITDKLHQVYLKYGKINKERYLLEKKQKMK